MENTNVKIAELVQQNVIGNDPESRKACMVPVRDAIGMDAPEAVICLKYDEKHPLCGQNKIIEDYKFQRPVVQWMLATLEEDLGRLQLVGDQGTGKSSHFTQLMERLGYGYLTYTCHDNAEPHEIFGTMGFGPNGEERFKYGPLPLAAKLGVPLLIEEIHTLPSGTRTKLNTALDGSAIVLEDNHCEIIQPAKGFMIIATSNDVTGLNENGNFASSQEQDASAIRRFRVCHVDHIGEDDELEILKATAPAVAEEYLKSLVQFANLTRKSVKEQSNPMTYALSLPESKDVAKYAELFEDMGMALEGCYLQKLSASDRAQAEIHRKAVFGTAA